MMNLLLSPSGRIGPSAYMKGMIIIAVIGAVINLLPLISPALGILGLLGLVLFYSLIALGIKRSHDAGKSGWMVLTHILLVFGVGTAVSIVVAMVTGVNLGDIFGAAFSGDLEAAEAASAAVSSPGYLIPSAIGGIASYAISAFLINMFNKQDMGDNQYGPVPAA